MEDLIEASFKIAYYCQKIATEVREILQVKPLSCRTVQ
jgi:hypothetical protein